MRDGDACIECELRRAQRRRALAAPRLTERGESECAYVGALMDLRTRVRMIARGQGSHVAGDQHSVHKGAPSVKW